MNPNVPTNEATKPLPEDQVIGPDDNGIKTVITYSYNENGRIVKTTQKIKEVSQVVKIPKKVMERKNNWTLFGIPAERGNDGVITVSVENIKMEHKHKTETSESDKVADKLQKKGVSSAMKCKFCGGSHFSMNCPYRELDLPMSSNDGEAAPEATEQKARYIPPNLRNKKPSDMSEDAEEEDPSVRVTNLSEDTTNDDLVDLCRDVLHCGVRRCNVLTDDNKRSKGVAFITFYNMDDAKFAVKELNNMALKYMIINVSLSTGRKRKPMNTERKMPSYMSGYGKALPQNVRGK